MYVNYIVDADQPHVTSTDASVVQPSRYIDHPMFWVALAVGTDRLNLGTRNPEHLATALREMADKLEQTAANYTMPASEVAA